LPFVLLLQAAQIGGKAKKPSDEVVLSAGMLVF
jgi:hypothetical protein